MTSESPIEILDAHGEITPDKLSETAEAYNNSSFEAPIVLGHPEKDSPAYGWIERLQVQGDRLLAYPKQVTEELKKLVRDGYYRKISASFYGPSNPNNPCPGRYFLKHVGLFGGYPVARKSLPAVQFSEDSAEILYTPEVDIKEEEIVSLAEDKVASPAGEVKIAEAEAEKEIQYSEVQPSPIEITSALERIEKASELFKQLQQKTKDLQRKQFELDSRSEFAEFAEGLISANKLLPSEKEGVVNLLMVLKSIGSEFGVLEFAEFDAIDWLKKFLERQQSVVDYAEVASRARTPLQEKAKSVTEAIKARYESHWRK